MPPKFAGPGNDKKAAARANDTVPKSVSEAGPLKGAAASVVE